MQLKVYYWPENNQIHQNIDDAIEKALEPFGFERWASGYNLEENCRDLSFDSLNRNNKEVRG